MLSCSNLSHIVHQGLSLIKDVEKRKRPISLVDTLMSGFAVFSLKYPSLLQFNNHYEEVIKDNLNTVYKIDKVHSDIQMRERLDELEPEKVRKTCKELFAQCQRSKHLELFKCHDNRYLAPLDGTGYFYSKEVHCEHCCEKKHSDSTIGYYHLMLSGGIVHPEQKVVLAFAPEAIMKLVGPTKNDCERRSAERFLEYLKREHPQP